MKSLREWIIGYRDALEAAKPMMDTWLRADAKKAPAGEEILATCQAIAAMLIEKNIAYGNSALEPMRIFSRASTEEQIRVRLDDKLSRLARGHAAGEDVATDLIGYLVLLKVLEVRGAEVSGRRGEVDHAGVRDRGVGTDSGGETAREPREPASASEDLGRKQSGERDGGASDLVKPVGGSVVVLGVSTADSRQPYVYRKAEDFLPQPGRCQSCNTHELDPDSVICAACAKLKGFGRGTNGVSEKTSEVVLTNRT